MTIGGFALSELATNATFEETLFLLREDRLPNAEELTSFSEKLAAKRELPEATYALLREIEASGDAEAAVHERLDAGKRLTGFGHRIYRTRDPRAAVLSTAAERTRIPLRWMGETGL